MTQSHVRSTLAAALLLVNLNLPARGAEAQPGPLTEGVAAGTATAPPAEGAATGVGAAQDCARWPASKFDPVAQACLCPDGMWWNLRGDACLPREHAAAELCGNAWPSSQPVFVEGGQYRCVCPLPSLWDPASAVCAVPPTVGAQECGEEWPGTMPVLAPSGTEFECRCPGGRRWDQVSRGCVDSAPPAGAARMFFPTVALPPSAAGPGPGHFGAGVAAPDGGFRQPRPEDSSALSSGGAAPLPVPAPSAPSPCETLLAEIRGRAAAGQKAEVDALGMRAAVRGCDPAAISDAVRGPAAGN